MNIKTRLALRFSLLVIAILLFFSLLVYYLSFENEKTSFSDELYMKAKNTAILLLNVAEVDSVLLKKIHATTISLDDEEISLFDDKGNEIYCYNNKKTANNAFPNLQNGDEILFFTIGKKDGICLRHNWNGKDYFVYVMAVDKKREENLGELINILLLSILFSILVAVLISYLFSRNAIRPISQINKGISEINLAKLDKRLPEGNKKDEIAQLAISFNEMLNSLEKAFRSQNEFVLNASHELKTPLAVMIVETDYILSHDHEKDGYILHLKRLLDDLKAINGVSTSLLELAQINEGMELKFEDIQIDEVIYASVNQIKNKYPDRKIIIKIDYPENESELLIKGHFGLLEIAFKNILDNSCKFSEDEILLSFLFTPEIISVSISDKGIGIPAGELDNIFKPFHRGGNAKFISGFGIGLALASKIFELHGFSISIHSTDNIGTSFDLIYKKKI
ncbi:MAG: hypothetical protein A2W91_04735 [Bacteroidetes bacterium GWF2_38_335]|nr:MAG: hypothetical protein A2W91_04735 [Bacteroidetes bacterium GWF2_38_335]OFY80026.1 MAG: hypothetical protein A2281_12120 [Bacteroidetes bacterium RIFOXYA12_FULL_38_20]HBS85238.1 hypothetical protein [Bacteroidales bacterium]